MLSDALLSLSRELSMQYQVTFLFVDDGSTDSTYKLLQELQCSLGNTQVLRHERNLNLGAALTTAIKNLPPCDYVCYLDSDCTYDPRIAKRLLEKLESGYDLVTASPYHPEGKVVGVPGWRLFLSRGLSLIYRLITGVPLHTFTAMVRAQRSEFSLPTLSQRSDFTFVTEVLLNSFSLGLRVGEIPAVLETRKFGVSKMRTLRTIGRHIGLIVGYCLGFLGINHS